MQEQKISALITPVLKDLGYRLVMVTLKGSDRMGQILEILAENPQTQNLGVDECARISRAVSAILDVEDPIKSTYRLEISSPGIDRPLIELNDYREWQGHEAKIELDMPLNNQKRFKGVIEGLNDDAITLMTDTGPALIPFASIAKARLVLTDHLIKSTKPLSQKTSQGDENGASS